MDFLQLIDVKPDERIIILRGMGESNVPSKYSHIVKNLKNILHARQLTEREYEAFLKKYEEWIIGQPVKIMHWECQDRLPSGEYVYSYDREKRILRARGEK